MITATLIGQSIPALNWETWPPTGGVAHWPDKPGDVLLIRCQWETLPRLQHTCHALLTVAEQQRAHRYRQAADRHRFVVGRGGARLLTGRLTNQPPATIAIDLTASGKPELVEAGGWQLTISHAGDWVVWALSRQAVGIDVETLKTGFAYHDLIDACFGPAEQAALQQAGQLGDDAHRRLFYTLWTRKEAILKATGIGLTDQLTAFSVLDGTQAVSPSAIGAAGTWHLYSFPLADAYLAALACQRPGAIRAFTLTDS